MNHKFFIVSAVVVGLLLLVGGMAVAATRFGLYRSPMMKHHWLGDSERGQRFEERQENRTQETSTWQKRGQGKGRVNQGNCVADECLLVENLEYPAQTLSSEVQTALNRALADEYQALATYEAVQRSFGNVRPFVMISRAEEQHIAALKALFDKYGMTVPENTALNQVTAPSSLVAACQTGVSAEKANAALYRNELLPVVKDYPDITNVFTNLLSASENRHLPAFERCAQ